MALTLLDRESKCEQKWNERDRKSFKLREELARGVSKLRSVFSSNAVLQGYDTREGGVHGVYKPGNVKLQPELLAKHQAYAHEQLKSENPSEREYLCR
jgi:hypothetical protein